MTAPIDPQDYLYGVKVVDIGEARIRRGKSRRPVGNCRHKRLIYDQAERRVRCEDCELDLESFDAFVILVENFDSAIKNLKAREEEIKKAESHNLISRAARKMDMVWRKHSMVPLCPHCSNPLLPEDILQRLPMHSRSLIAAKFKKDKP